MKPIRVFNHRLHKEMWYWLAIHPDKYKHDWPGWRKLSRADREMMKNEYSLCFACYAADYRSGDLNALACSCCPLDWGRDIICRPKSLYADWFKNILACNYDLASKYARRIAKLPLRKNLDGGRFVILVI